MIAYYFYNLLMYLVSRAGLRVFLAVVFLSYPAFLYFLPETGFDFIHYQYAYETVYFDPRAPLLFRSRTPLTAEPGWFLYTGIVHFIIEDFRTFLVVNFLLTTSIIVVSFKKFGLPNKDSAQILSLMIPVQFIVMYFWSARSSLPLALTFLYIAYLRQGNIFIALLFAIMTVLIHSQYGLIIVFCGLYYLSVLAARKKKDGISQVSVPVLIGISSGTIAIALMANTFLPLLSFMPSFDIIISKTRYLSMESDGFRVTSLLSIVFFPALIALKWKELSARKEFDVVVAFAAFSLIVNVVFFSNAHVAGRLARASDYFLFGYCVLEFSKSILRRDPAPIVLLILIILPFLFTDLYRLTDFL